MGSGRGGTDSETIPMVVGGRWARSCRGRPTVKALLRPGGNITGLGLTTKLGCKELLRLLNEAVTKCARVAVLYRVGQSGQWSAR